MASRILLKDLVEIFLGLTHTPEYVQEGVPFLSVKDISNGKIDFSKCNYITEEEYNSLPRGAKPQPGDMLFCRVGTIGKPVIIESGTQKFGSFVSLGFFRLKDTTLCKLEYLYYWMFSDSFYSQVKENVKGASQVNLNTGWLSKFEVPMYSIEEQKNIIRKLGQIDNLIELRREQLNKLDELVKSRFIEMFDNIVKTRSKMYLEDISEFVTVGIANSATHAYSDSGIVMLRNQNIKENYLDDEYIIYITPEFAKKYGSKKLVENDILVIRTGYPGVACLVPKKYEGCQTFTTLIVRLKDSSLIHAKYVCHYINSKFGSEYVEQSKVGVAQQNFGAKALSKMPIVVPEIELQEQFATFVEQIDKSKFEIQKSLEKLEILKKALMQKYFG